MLCWLLHCFGLPESVGCPFTYCLSSICLLVYINFPMGWPYSYLTNNVFSEEPGNNCIYVVFLLQCLDLPFFLELQSWHVMQNQLIHLQRGNLLSLRFLKKRWLWSWTIWQCPNYVWNSTLFKWVFYWLPFSIHFHMSLIV